MRIFWLLIFLLLATNAGAEIQITSPPKNSETYQDILPLSGVSVKEKQLSVNGVSVPIDKEGAFSCGLIVNQGKNLIDVVGEKDKKTIKVLKLLSYPDIKQATESKKHWAAKEINSLATLGIIEGGQDGNFYPGSPITRGEFATWLARADELPVIKATNDVFFDVPKEHWRAPYIKAVATAGYIAPYPNQLFGLDDPISRRETAEILARTGGGTMGEKTTKIFRDIEAIEEGALPIYTAQSQGLIQGVSKDTLVFDPERALTRAEAAIIISRLNKVQLKIASLFNYKSGYNRLCGINLKPEIKIFKVEPNPIDIGVISNLRLTVKLAARKNLSPIMNVKADLSSLGGPVDAEMAEAGDYYFLDFAYQPKESGEKKISVTAIDRLGWEGKREAGVLTVE